MRRSYYNSQPYNFIGNLFTELNRTSEVREIQNFLLNKGYNLGHWGADGKLGRMTNQAIYDYFQRIIGNTTNDSNNPTPQVPISSLTAQKLQEVFRQKNYQFYTSELKLNIIGIRNLDAVDNLFDDQLFVIWTENNQLQMLSYSITTDPGSAYLGSRMINEKGTAILKEGQYINAYLIGLHRGKYKALVQRGAKVTVIRDNNQNNRLDFHSGKAYTGYFGINIHKAARDTTQVNDWSAGCQVFKRETDFNEFISLCERSRGRYGNSTKFTYTLLEMSNGIIQ